jgi:hypothetical protein
LKISSALLLLVPSTYSEKKRSVGAAPARAGERSSGARAKAANTSRSVRFRSAGWSDGIGWNPPG